MSVARAVLMEAGIKSEVQLMDLMDSGMGGLERFWRHRVWCGTSSWKVSALRHASL